MQTLGGRQFWGDVQFFRGWRIQRNVFTGHYRLLDENDFRHAWGTLEDCRGSLETVRRDTKSPFPRRGVILIHGILRSSKSMSTISRGLRNSGWATFPFDYPSSQVSIQESAEYLQSVIQQLDDLDDLNVVCHSLGGLVLRAWFGEHDDPRLQRVVMLGTPNRGAALADMLRKNLIYRAVYGPSGQQLVTDPEGYIPKLPSPRCEFAIIAGARGTPDGWNPLIPGDDDGTVSVDAAQLEGAADFSTVRALHSNLLHNAQVIEQIERFFETGHLLATESK